jgi:Bacterial protein of unknown function (DUF885)
MPRRFAVVFALLSPILFAAPAFAESPAPAATAWNLLVDDFLDHELFPSNPTIATHTGVHDYDAKLEDFSSAGIAKHIAILKKFEARTMAFDPKGLTSMDAADREMLLSAIRSTLLSLEVIRGWEKDPDTYSSGAAGSVYVIMSRKFAAPDERLRSVVSREKEFPRYFASARANLKNVPRIYTEIALEQLPGTIGFFEKDVPAAFLDAKDSATKAAFSESNTAAIATLREYEKWLRTDLLSRSNGDFRIGADVFPKSFSTTTWSPRRSTAFWKSAWPTCTKIRRSFSASRKRSIPENRRPKSLLNSSRCIRPPAS